MSTIMYQRYKDDVNVILKVDRGDVSDETDGEIMERVRVVADEVDPNLKVTTDNKDKHAKKRAAVLDLEVWIGKDEMRNNKTLYGHYMKPVASRNTIHWRSSHSREMKKNLAMNEMISMGDLEYPSRNPDTHTSQSVDPHVM